MNPEYRTGTQIITLRAEILNSEGRFVPGMQASVVLTDDNREALTLPVDAVIRGEAGAHVWVKIGEGTFAPRMVTTGLETFAEVDILKGLNVEDPPVFSGEFGRASFRKRVQRGGLTNYH